MWRLFLACLRRFKWGAMGASCETAEQHRKTRLTFILFLLITLALAGQVAGQSVTNLKGIIVDEEDGTPLAGAVIDIQGTGYTALADEYGFYSFENLPVGDYTLKIAAPGYESAYQAGVKIIDGISRQINARLYRKVYYLGKISVQGQRRRLTTDNVEILQRDEIIRSRARDIPELLETVPGVYIQETGSGSGRSQIKIRGSAPEHVLVLVDGHRINSSGSGIADLSSIPIEMVERLEIHKGGASAEFGPDALGGVLNIITQKTQLGEKLSVDGERGWGSWKNELYHFDISDLLISGKFSGNFAYSLRQSIGDFDFSYQVEPDPVAYSGTRINNRNESINYFSSGIYRFNERLRLTSSGQYYQSESGLPGGARTQNAEAFSEDSRKMVNSSLLYELSPDRDLKLDIGVSRFEQHFADVQSALKYDTRYINDVYTLRHTQHLSGWHGNRMLAGGEYRRDVLEHEDIYRPSQSMGTTVRDNLAIFVNDKQHFDLDRLKLIDEVVLDFSIRFDHVNTDKESLSWQDQAFENSLDHWSQKAGLALSKGEKFSYLLRGSYGRSLRLPSINALFWKGDARSSGNPSLKPERSKHAEAGIELKGESGKIKISGGITYFHSDVTDLVVWMPNSGIWQPVNNSRALITGHEDFVELDLFDRLFTLLYQNTITTAVNKDTVHTVYDKRLVFYPHYVTTLTARINYSPASFSYSIRKVARAYTTAANTRYYEGYRVDDIGAGIQFNVKEFLRVGLDFKLNNMFDKSYELMTHYPMPGREWYLGAKLTYGLGHSK